MPITVIDTNTIVSGFAYVPTTIGDGLFVLPNVTLMSTDTQVANITLAEVTIQVDGTLVGATRALTFEAAATFGHVYIGRSGTISAFRPDSNEVAIAMLSSRSGVTNHGEIRAPEAICVYQRGTEGDILNTGLMTGALGIQLALGSTDSRIVNYGTITGSNQFDGTLGTFEGRGILVESANAYVLNGASGIIGSTATGGTGLLANGNSGGLVFSNFGDVWATGGIGVDLSLVSNGQAQIQVSNFGTISGQNGSYTGSVNADALTNRGLMAGDVDTGGGADNFDNRSGTVEGDVRLGDGDDTFDTRGGSVSGEIDGGAGNDLILSNTDVAEVLLGGDGTVDILDMRFGPGAIVALDGAFENAGSALGDVIGGFEYLFGSFAEADNLRGNGLGNFLFSFGGADVLDGAGGDDVLRGGTGQDTLTGGAGNDAFRFFTISEFGDVVTDFSSVGAGNNDHFQFSAAALGGGLAAGFLAANQFRTRADNAAQDADDRFIFRTTDTTLWYDADGSGAAAAILIADLQAGATVTNADILLLA